MGIFYGYLYGKKIKQKEVQVVVLKNNDKKIKLVVLLLEDAKAKVIVSALINFLNELDIWEVIKVIICDNKHKYWNKRWCCSIFKKRVYSQEIRSSTIY